MLSLGGFDRVLAGYWTNAADGFLVLARAAAAVRRLNFLLAHRPGFLSPTLAARKLATLDHLTGGRIGWNVVTGYLDSAARAMGVDGPVPSPTFTILNIHEGRTMKLYHFDLYRLSDADE